MIIKKAKIKDAKSCYKLSKIRELLTAQGKPNPLSYLEEVIKENRSIFLVAEEDSKIIGYISIGLLPAKIAVIWFISVHPDYQSKGVGKELLIKAEKECKKKGCKYLVSYTVKFNKKTSAFYRKMGFRFGEDMIEILKKL